MRRDLGARGPDCGALTSLPLQPGSPGRHTGNPSCCSSPPCGSEPLAGATGGGSSPQSPGTFQARTSLCIPRNLLAAFKRPLREALLTRLSAGKSEECHPIGVSWSLRYLLTQPMVLAHTHPP